MLYRLSILFVLFISLSLFADSTERQLSEEELFLRKGFNYKHYQAAKKLNLNLENYSLYRENKRDRVSGAIMASTGGSLVASGGLFLFLSMLSLSIDEPTVSSDSDSGEDFLWGSSFCLMGAGTSLIIVGAVRRIRARRRTVFRKDGTELGLQLSPIMNPINSNIGLQLSLQF